MQYSETEEKLKAQDALRGRGFDLDIHSVLRSSRSVRTLLDLYFPKGSLQTSEMGSELANVREFHVEGDHFTDVSNAPLCGLFTVYGEAVDPMTGERVLYVRHLDSYQRPVTTRLPYNDIATGGAALAKTLSNAGLWVTSTKKGRESLAAMLATIKPPRITLATSYGWLANRNIFILGDKVFGAKDGDRTHVENSYVGKVKLAQRGSLDDWSASVGRYAAGNSRLIFALGMAFSSPLLRFIKNTSFVANLHGDSSVGKSTALNVFGSVWGGSEGALGFNHSWDMTDKDAAKKAASHSYIGLGLDEQGQMSGDPARVAYSIASGIERGRLNKDSSEREQAVWHVAVLSTGERSISEIIETKNPRDRQASGVEVRNFDIPADTGAHGIFDELHGFANGRRLAEHLADATSETYGTAGPAYIERLVQYVNVSGADVVAKELRSGIDDFLVSLDLPDDADDSYRRIAKQFAIVAVSARLACRLGVLPLAEDEAFDGVRKCFNDWARARGSTKSRAKIVDLLAVRDFIQINSGKFPRISTGKADLELRRMFDHENRIGNGLGFRLTARVNGKERQCFGITSAGWKSLRLARGNVLGQLETLGLIESGSDAKHTFQRQVRLPDGTRQWLYVVDAAVAEITDNGRLDPDLLSALLPTFDDYGNVVPLMVPPVSTTLRPTLYGRDQHTPDEFTLA